MKIRRITAAAVVIVLLSLACTASGAAGDPADPFVSRSYVDGSFSEAVIKDAKNAFAFTGEQLRAQTAAGVKKNTGSFSLQNITAGSVVKLGIGDSIVLLSGAANVEIQSGALVNVTAGAEAGNGKILKNNRYLGCEDATVTVSFSENATVALDGKPQVIGSSCPFTDVRPDDWYYSDVVAAVERGLVNGMTPTTYAPSGTLTAAQCIKLAACMNQLYFTGNVSLSNSTEGNWFDSYVNYAFENGILLESFADYNAVISRVQFVQIFYRALPVSCYGEINSIMDGSIPDVSMSDAAAEEIYTFYRAGILTGYSNSAQYANFAFGAKSSISRAEVATILNRMFDSSARRNFSIS